MEKGTSQFYRSVGRCGAMRRVVHAGMPLGCLLPASLGEITSFSKKKTLIFRKSLQICRQAAAKAKTKATPHRHAAAKATATPMSKAVKAKARSQGHGFACVGTLACH